MSRLDELIAELCPSGVKYVPLKQIAEVGTGSSDRVNAVDDGEYPFYVRSKNILRSNRYLFDEEAIIIPGEGGIGDIFHYVNGKYDLHQRAYRIHLIDPNVNTKFTYYCLSANFKKFIIMKAVNATVTSIRKPMIENFPIPLPPLPVQQEIVRILDDLTKATTELNKELNIELEARRKQYEYYIDRVINANNYQHIPLNDVAKVYDGTHQTPNYTESGVKFVSVENINDLYGTTKRISEVDFSKYKIKPQPGDVFMTRIGDVGTPAVVTTNEPIAYYVSLALIRPNKELLPQYLYFYIKSSAFRKELYKRTLHTAVPIKINKEDIGKCRVAVPPIKEQQRVIALLSRFDTLCNDISSGLPAEIEARQKQYEYYRDKLLTFKEVTG